MYKIKNTYINKMISSKLSSREIDFILYIALYQNDCGTVESVYYKDVCSSLNISIQSFYNIIERLSNCGLILCEKPNNADIRITLLNNDFSMLDYKNDSEGYMNVEKNDFASDRFKTLKAGSKLLYLYSQRFMNGKHMRLDKFYSDFSDLFGVTAKSIQLYVHQLKERALLFISRKRNRSYNYEISFKLSTVLHRNPIWMKRENDGYRENMVSLVQNNFRKNLPSNNVKSMLNDIVNSAISRLGKNNNTADIMIQALNRSIDIKIKEGQNKPVLNAALFNKCLCEIV